MADLYWFPFFTKDWLSSPARMAMTPEQRGAYIDLLAFAWGNGATEPCLDPSPVILAGLSGLGKRWAKVSPLVLAQFVERGGLLYNVKLSEVWRDSQAKHESAVIRGSRGGRARAAKLKLGSSSATAEGVAEPYQSQSQSQEEVKTPKEFLPSSPPEALGVETPRPAERGRITNGKPDRLSALVDRIANGFQPKAAT